MKIILAGGTGQVGRVLKRAFSAAGDEVIVLSRHGGNGAGEPVARWDGRSLGNWVSQLDGADVVVNLAGHSVNCRYNQANRREIIDSRINSVRTLGAALRQIDRPPRVWLQAATATIYAHTFDRPNDEVDGVIGGNEPDAPDTWRFSIDVATAWERAVAEVGPLPATRRVIMRSAMIMSPDRGGIFATLRTLARFGLGGRAGSGRQFISWIHEYDFVRAVRHLIEHAELDGPVNICSPNPLPNRVFMRTLCQACGVRVAHRAAKWMLEIGACLMRTETELILKSRRVVPRRLLESGFAFQFPRWPEAARDLCARYPSD